MGKNQFGLVLFVLFVVVVIFFFLAILPAANNAIDMVNASGAGQFLK